MSALARPGVAGPTSLWDVWRLCWQATCLSRVCGEVLWYVATAAWAVFVLGYFSRCFPPGRRVTAWLAPAFGSCLKSWKAGPGWYLSSCQYYSSTCYFLISLVCGRAPTIRKQNKYSQVGVLISCDEILQQLSRPASHPVGWSV